MSEGRIGRTGNAGPARWGLALALLLGVGSPARAAESVFGLSYFGGHTELADGRIEGRAGMGFAYRDSLNASVLLATQLADLEFVTLSASSQFEGRNAKTIDGEVGRWGLVTPSVSLGFPLGTRGGLGVGFRARRSTQWKLDQPYQDQIFVRERIEREGTQFSVPFRLALRFNRWLVAGAGLHVERGTIRMRYDLDLPGSASVDPSEVREDVWTALSGEFALAVQDIGPFSMAGYYIPEHGADVDVTQVGIALGNRIETRRTDTLPSRWGVGARFALGRSWSFGSDFELERWRDYRGRSFRFRPNDPEELFLQNEYELRVGLEKEARRIGIRYSRPLRLGAYWRRWHYQLQGNDVAEWGFTLGTGIHLPGAPARADLVLGYGQIGSFDENGAEESVLRIMFSIAGGERWY